MSITEKLTSSKNALASLLDYANAKTEKNDPDIGEAIKTLVDGYGQGGGAIEYKLLCILPSEMTLKDILNNYPIPFSETSGIVFMLHKGANAASTGGTSNWAAFLFSDATQSSNQVGRFIIYNYSNSTVAPDTMSVGNSISGGNGTYFTWNGEFITASGSTNTARRYAAGNSIYYAVIPFDILHTD